MPSTVTRLHERDRQRHRQTETETAREREMEKESEGDELGLCLLYECGVPSSVTGVSGLGFRLSDGFRV